MLALLLVGYVFGYGSSRDAQQVAGGPGTGSTARCYSRETSELLKRELFRRATALRGRDQAGMAQIANFSVVRVTSAVAAVKGDADICTASLMLELPPDVSAVGGRRRLKGNAKYEVRTGANGEGQLRLASKVDQIVTPLATLIGVGSAEAEPLAVPPIDGNMVASEPAGTVPTGAPPPDRPAIALPPPATSRPVTDAPPRVEAAKRPPPRVETAQRPPPPAPPKREVAAAPPRRPPPPAEPPRQEATAKTAPTTVEPSRQASSVRPSFDCRRARTRSERAVCGDAGLANLDRQMSSQFFSALRSARPGQRALLQRSRNRFIAYRNRCGSQACIAQAYRERMREINDIMTGGF